MKPTHLSRQQKMRTPSTARKTNITTPMATSTSISKLTRLPDTEGLTKDTFSSSSPSSKRLPPSFRSSSKAGLYPNAAIQVPTASHSAAGNQEVSQITANASPNSVSVNDQTMDEEATYSNNTGHSPPDHSDINQVTTMTDNTFQSHSSSSPASTNNKVQHPFDATLEAYPPLSRHLVNPLPDNMTPPQSGHHDEDSDGCSSVKCMTLPDGTMDVLGAYPKLVSTCRKIIHDKSSGKDPDLLADAHIVI